MLLSNNNLSADELRYVALQSGGEPLLLGELVLPDPPVCRNQPNLYRSLQ